ncbi:cupin domain-containing protein [Vibrio parahaemolyticus]|nr:cupin domain-containing protein [Vibrio parahaemolyticus]HCM1323109.1 hypothetical protein [Vibrio parahaemolyticus]HCM1328047.1 hypothetical protein [Vibrio parahaemolyticus]
MNNIVKLVRRDDVPSIRTVEVDGVEHWLGHVKDFTKHKHLVDFLPKDNRISMAWVRLEAGEQLDVHTHPVESLILLCEGNADTLGDVQSSMVAGDALLVPPQRPHGFKGGYPNGFWGLSIQFDSRGLYEELSDPWAAFDEDMKVSEVSSENIIDKLFEANEVYMEHFDKHRLFALVNKGLLNNESARNRFLDCFQVWSNYFQKMVLSRALNTQDSEHLVLAWEHFTEELGHNTDLANSRDKTNVVFDPVLEASSSWFANIIPSLTDSQKVVLVHLVVEASATYFYKHLKPAMEQDVTKAHFDNHHIDDHDHVKMGYDFIRRNQLTEPEKLLEIQKKGWSMLETVMGRIADLVVHFVDSESNEKNVVPESEVSTAE